jgi:uncharacterized membrane protein YfcA
MDPAIAIFGFGIGLLVGMTGMGGASLMTPLLILVFGIEPVTAIGTDLFYGAAHGATSNTARCTARCRSGLPWAASRPRSGACS